ncbi:MAG TPA: TIGR00730 family Rossman fold protein, partial [Parvularculaceae bacterium]|nr:TIGR00730 family Rossman fold protein [Parvularculaceae bacterium]
AWTLGLAGFALPFVVPAALDFDAPGAIWFDVVFYLLVVMTFAGGAVFGIIPDFLVDLEGVLEDVDHTIVKTMHERKMMMFEESDAILTLPGGIGTLEELIETLSWARLALHRKPIIVLNLDGFWTPLKALFEHIVEREFAATELLNDLTFVDRVEDVFPLLAKRTLEEVA